MTNRLQVFASLLANFELSTSAICSGLHLKRLRTAFNAI